MGKVAVLVLHRDGRRLEVEADDLGGGLAAHPSIDEVPSDWDAWTLTHMRSGKAVGRYPTLSACRAVSVALLGLTPWLMTADPEATHTAREFFDAVCDAEEVAFG